MYLLWLLKGLPRKRPEIHCVLEGCLDLVFCANTPKGMSGRCLCPVCQASAHLVDCQNSTWQCGNTYLKILWALVVSLSNWLLGFMVKNVVSMVKGSIRHQLRKLETLRPPLAQGPY